LVCQCN